MFKQFCIFVLLCLGSRAFGQVENSVLNSREWYKIGVLEKGIYKIDRSFLETNGIDPNGISPSRLAIFGNGGNGMLPQANSEPRENDLVENAILVVGEEDGTFDANDYILFYGNSPDLIEYNSEENRFVYENNLYSDTTFYFLTIKETDGLRVIERENLEGSFNVVSDSRQLLIHEVDQTNLIFGGRRWFGEDFTLGRPERSFQFPISGLSSGGNILISLTMMAQAFIDTAFDIELNGKAVGSITINDIPDRTYDVKGDIQTGEFLISGSEIGTPSELNVQITYNAATQGTSIGFLDYMIIEFEQNLSYTSSQFHFYNSSGFSETTLELSNTPADVIVWDITNPRKAISQKFNLGGNVLSFSAKSENKEFIAFSGANFPSPSFSGEIDNQNLHGLPTTDALLITHKNFLNEALQLQAHRENMVSGFNIHTVTVDQIYNEFSSGMQDVTAIRDFIKYIYQKDPERLKYVLLFGDCSYDYKGRTITQTNFVPVYEARNSLHPLFNFSSDDYFGFMENDEGEWLETKDGDHTLELGIGRIPVKTRQEAQDAVDKIIRYETNPNSFGDWRNDMLFIADDGDNNIHQRDANILATYVENTRSEFNIDKLYIDAFEQISSPSGQSAPEARQAFEEAVEEGRLMINYTGHGNEAQLTVEEIIDENQIAGFTNRNRLPFFITATCEFGNYDNPERVSGGEKAILNPNGGAIALLTSTRPVFSNTNFILNEAYYFAAMNKENGTFPRLGDIIRNTKNSSLEGAKNRNFALLGDPTMRLAFPKYDLAITSINGKVVNMADTLKALSKVRMSGEVRNPDLSVVSDFNGVVSVEVFDKPTQFSTLGNENTLPQQFDRRDALLFKGDASVANGFFSFEFVVPKNISYVLGDGKVSMYALDKQQSVPLDANGSNIDLRVGGTDPAAAEDNTPPEVSLFMNNFDFQSGQGTGRNPLFLAQLSDENGINVSNQGFGQNITMSVNGGEHIILNEFYSADLDTYQQGLVSYPLNDLSPGDYTIDFRAFDTHNNPVSAQINFVVSEDIAIRLSNISAYPNPVRSSQQEVTFLFSHDRLGEELIVDFQIINLQGRKITESRYRFDDSSSQTNRIVWDGKDSSGNALEKGIYIYKLLVQSTLDGAKNEAHRKLVIFY